MYLDKALTFFQKSLSIYRDNYGKEIIEVSWIYNKLAITYEQMGEANKALPRHSQFE